MLNIKDIAASKELDSNMLASVTGGNSQMRECLAILMDGSTSMDSRVANVTQAFGLGLTQNNAAAVTNNQAIQGGNGIVYAPVDQSLSQANWMDVYDIGNTSVS